MYIEQKKEKILNLYFFSFYVHSVQKEENPLNLAGKMKPDLCPFVRQIIVFSLYLFKTNSFYLQRDTMKAYMVSSLEIGNLAHINRQVQFDKSRLGFELLMFYYV